MTRKEMKEQKLKSKKSLIIKISVLLVAGILISGSAYGFYLVKKAETAAEKSYEAV